MMDWERIGQYIRNASQENLNPYLNFLYFNSAEVSSHFWLLLDAMQKYLK